MHKQAIGEALVALADALERDLSKGRTLETYVAAMQDLSPESCVMAFSTALETCRFFPSPAQLRELASPAKRVIPAMVALRQVLEAMRIHGPELRPLPGAVLDDGRDSDGRCLPFAEWKRAPETLPPELSGVIRDAIINMGQGAFGSGLNEISRHPALRSDSQRGHLGAAGAGFEARDREKLESRWIEAYQQAEAEGSRRER